MNRSRRPARALGAALITTIALITVGTAEGSAQPAPTPTPSPTPGSSSVPHIATRELPAPEEATDTRVRSRSTVLDGPVATSTADRSLAGGVQTTPSANRVVGTVHAAGGSTVVTPGALTTLASVTDRKPSRLAGADRYSTAAQISAAGHPSGSSRVYVATGENFPDGLAASRAAAHHGAPLLLTRGTSLPSVTRQELLRLAPNQVIVVGGTGVVSSSVQSAIAQAVPTATIRRVAGANRFETAAALARADATIPTIAFVATGANFPDALAAGPVAAHRDGSLLLAASTSLPTATARELARTRPKTTVIVGGPEVISDGVRAAIASATGGDVRRISGANRYETAAALSRSAFTATTSTVVLATGLGFADALSAGALAGFKGGPVLLDAGQAKSPRATTDEARRLSWYVGTADGPVLRYVPEVHPDDNMSAGSLLPATPGRYDVFILLTRGEATANCTGQSVSTRWMNQEFLPQPQPTGVRFSDRCRDHRVASWHEFLDRLAGPDDPMGQVERHQGQSITWNGRTLPTPTHLVEDGSSRPADYVDVAIGPRSARFAFDLGDGQLTRDKVIWAMENARRLRTLLPTQSEGDIVAGGYFNDTGAGSPYLHADHKALHDVLGTTDFGLPGSQYSPIGHADSDRAFGAWGGDYCANMCHPADTNGWANGMGRFQYSYGWLRWGKWETGTLDVHAGFSEYQSFGKWY